MAELFVCPACRGGLTTDGGGYRCRACRREYPVALGFPDFRIRRAADVPDDDFEVAAELARREEHLDFSGLVDLLRQIRPPARPDLFRRHEAHFDAERRRARRVTADLAAPGAFLDVGCGMGEYLAAASSRFSACVGADASLTQLVLARKRLAEAPVLLVAANAEALPFAADRFAAVTATDLLEHLDDPESALREIARVLAPSGRAYFTTPNRFSLTAEPHVGIWGLGYLPRPWAEALVLKRLGIDYGAIRPPSLWALRRMLHASFTGRCMATAPAFPASERDAFPPILRFFASVYEAFRRLPGFGRLVVPVAPYFEAACCNQPGSQFGASLDRRRD